MTHKLLDIYFTSDLHGYFYPTDYRSLGEKNIGLFKCANRFRKDENTLIIDGGDILQGSAFAAYCHDSVGNAAIIAKIMNLCGYDFVTLGNHDFNYGTGYLNTYLQALDATCVCQNIYAPNKKVRFPYLIKTMQNGLRVGIVGIVTDHINIWEKPEHLKGMKIGDPFSAAKAALDKIRGQADVTLCIYHGGFERDLSTGQTLSTSSENIAYRLCEELDFDLLLTGHQHMSIEGRFLHGTYVVQPTDCGKEFHHIQVTVDGQKKSIMSEVIAAAGKCSPQLQNKFLEEEKGTQLWLDEVVGTLDHELLPDSAIKMASQGSEIAAFFNQIQLAYSGACISAVSLANEIAGFPKIVRRRDILTTYPYPNTLAVLSITGSLLRQAIERTAEYFDLNEKGQLIVSDRFTKPKVEHYNYDYYAGVSYVIDVSKPLGHRVTELLYDEKPVRNDDIFSICVNNYRASGAGGYHCYEQCPVLKEINTEMVDLIMKYFEENQTILLENCTTFRVVQSASITIQ